MKAIMPATPVKSDSMARQRLISSTPAERRFGSPRSSGVAFQAVPNMAAQAQPSTRYYYFCSCFFSIIFSNQSIIGNCLGLSLTRPILQRDRGAFDKLVDMIIGDGPSNRYALICRVCCSHNGMALKNEFEYLGNEQIFIFSSPRAQFLYTSHSHRDTSFDYSFCKDDHTFPFSSFSDFSILQCLMLLDVKIIAINRK